MSVINQMLQELDARPGSPHTVGEMQREIRPAASRPASHAAAWTLLLLLALAGAAVTGYFTWRHFAAPAAAPGLDLPPELSLKISAALLATGPVPPGEVVDADTVLATNDTPLAPDTGNPAAPFGMTGKLDPMPAPPAPPVPAASATATPAAAAAQVSAAVATAPVGNAEPSQRHAGLPPGRNAEPQRAGPKTPGRNAAPSSAAEAVQPAEPVRENETPRQQADSEYSRGIRLARQGQSAAAIASFERAVQLAPDFVPAHQSLATQLIEAKRTDEALQRLQQGLAANRASGALAMMLARIQLDRGDTNAAIETLARSLPYDLDRPDHHSFMAALLQKENRHREAIDYYLNALRKSPRNGVWWMGIGISLQAENRRGEARDAFIRARELGGMSAELQGFISQRLDQLN